MASNFPDDFYIFPQLRLVLSIQVDFEEQIHAIRACDTDNHNFRNHTSGGCTNFHLCANCAGSLGNMLRHLGFNLLTIMCLYGTFRHSFDLPNIHGYEGSI